MRSKLLLVFISGLMLHALTPATAQTCSAPSDNTTTYGTNNRWWAYFYRNEDLTSYHGRVRYGTTSNPNFDLNFQGSNVNYDPDDDPAASSNSFNCDLPTETFSIRMRLTKSFTAGAHDFTLGADDGVRLYIDNVLIIDEWNDHPYTIYTATVQLTNGNHNLVIEYYERNSENRLSFSTAPGCLGTGSTATYGTTNQWIGYVYKGMNFNFYKGSVTAGAAANPFFDTNFGGDNVTYNASACAITTENFSVRYRLRKEFTAGTYVFTVGGDDGYRLSLDGGTTWVIDAWTDHGFQTTPYVATFTTTAFRNLVLEYYENTGGNRIYFDVGVPLPVSLTQFDGSQRNGEATLNWITTPESTEDHFVVERSTDGSRYTSIGKVHSSAATAAPNGNRKYSYRDPLPASGNAFYRLQIIDKFGPTKYSSIVNVNTKAATHAKIYPTIIDHNKLLFIQSDRNATDMEVTIRNIAGQQVFIKKLGTISRGQIATLPLQNVSLSKGTYVVHVYAAGAVMHKQLITMP